MHGKNLLHILSVLPSYVRYHGVSPRPPKLHSDLRPERSGMAGMVEVTFLSLKSVYSILDRYRFPLVRSEVSCLCDCPGGAAHCHPGLDLCQNQVVKIFLR